MIQLSRIAKMIDHSILHPTFTDDDLKKNCEIARKYQVATVCVKPYHTKMAAAILANSGVGVCAVVGFPHGNSSIAIKVAETQQVITDGATEVDMVINIGKVLQADWDYIDTEIKAVNDVCTSMSAILKVIFETDFVTADEDKIKLCKLCSKHQVAFVKTSTGYGFVKGSDGKYSYSGALAHDIVLMRQNCSPQVQVKASGGIRNLNQILEVMELGATRVGATATEAILEEARKRIENKEDLKLKYNDY